MINASSGDQPLDSELQGSNVRGWQCCKHRRSTRVKICQCDYLSDGIKLGEKVMSLIHYKSLAKIVD